MIKTLPMAGGIVTIASYSTRFRIIGLVCAVAPAVDMEQYGIRFERTGGPVYFTLWSNGVSLTTDTINATLLGGQTGVMQPTQIDPVTGELTYSVLSQTMIAMQLPWIWWTWGMTITVLGADTGTSGVGMVTFDEFPL